MFNLLFYYSIISSFFTCYFYRNKSASAFELISFWLSWPIILITLILAEGYLIAMKIVSSINGGQR